MPWRETSPMEQRLDFVREDETELFTMTELAAQYGISRKTGYKWLERYAADGATGLQDRSRRPQPRPHATDPALVAILRGHPRGARRRRPAGGSRGGGLSGGPPGGASGVGAPRSCSRSRRGVSPMRTGRAA